MPRGRGGWGLPGTGVQDTWVLALAVLSSTCRWVVKSPPRGQAATGWS